MELLKLNEVNSRIVTIRNQKVILDSDVATLYGVKTKEINQAVRNNPGKFPAGYIFELTPDEKSKVVENFHNPSLTSKNLMLEGDEVVKNFDHPAQIKLSPTLPKAFTERGLYMLATILKSPQATQTITS